MHEKLNSKQFDIQKILDNPYSDMLMTHRVIMLNRKFFMKFLVMRRNLHFTQHNEYCIKITPYIETGFHQIHGDGENPTGIVMVNNSIANQK